MTRRAERADESRRGPPEKRWRKAQRGDRAFASLLAAAAGGLSGWVVFRAFHNSAGGVAAAIAAAAFTYWILTRRLRADLKVLARPIPDWWVSLLDDALPYFRTLDSDRRLQFLRRAQLFLADQRIEGVHCEVTDEDRVLLAGAAVMMAFGLRRFRYPNHRDFLVYPTAFDTDYQLDDEGDRVGEILDAGPVILSLPELRRGFTDEDWTNVAVHELAHFLDAVWSSEPGEFESDFDAELQELLEDPKLQKKIIRGRSPIDDYALEDPQEFFAVTSEVFFEDPILLRQKHPRVHRWLVRIYRQDPAELFDRADGDR